jgi:hypothetical protein
MQRISVLEFLRTGSFGPLSIGMPEAQVRSLFGEPTDELLISRRSRKRGERPSSLLFEDLETGFDPRPQLVYLILHFHWSGQTNEVRLPGGFALAAEGFYPRMPLGEFLATVDEASIRLEEAHELGSPILTSPGGVKIYTNHASGAPFVDELMR